MRIEIVNGKDFGRRAAEIACDTVRRKGAAVLGLPTGRTPLDLYAELSRRVAAQETDFSETTAFAIDELCGVPNDHPATNASYLARTLAGVSFRALHILDSAAADAAAECARYAELLERAGGLDLAVLGIGRNGHIAFNEPGSAFDSRTRRVRLDDVTREQYVRAFGSLDQTPEFGLTLGMAELLASREVLLFANGPDKAAVVARALEGAVTKDVPASALQRHDNVVALLDRGAAEELRDQIRG